MSKTKRGTGNKQIQILRKGVLGVDPGKQGGFALITSHKLEVFPFPESLYDLWEILNELKDRSKFAIIEHVQAIYGSSAAGTFTFGNGFGRLEMGLVAAGIPFEYVRPKLWQKSLTIPPRNKVGRKFTESSPQYKKRLRDIARRLYPRHEVWRQGEGVQMAVCDAILLAEYGKRLK